MTAFIIIAVLVSIFFFIRYFQGKKKIESSKESLSSPSIDITLTSIPDESQDYHEPIKQANGGWVINPGTPFELTVLDCNFETASLVRDLCNKNDSQASHELLALFATNNIRIKEIEAYKHKYAPVYFQRFEELRSASIEYQDADPKDRADMEEEFKITAQDCLYELPQYDVYKLFVDVDITIDDDLLQRYGFDCLEAYLSYYGKIGSVVTASKDAYYRAAFEKMEGKGMAIRGKDIPVTEILNAQNLKTLNAIASNCEKEFKRKNQAIEYILGDNESISRIGKLVAFRELFKLIPLPNEYDGLDLEAIFRIWECHRVEIQLLMRTYNDSVYQWKRLKEEDGSRTRLYKTCKVSCTNDRCKCAQDRMKQTYSVENPPQTPCHIGCSCWLDFE